jgi:hypothetical protein
MIRAFKIWIARRRLERLIRERAASYECEQFRRRRAAALKHTRGMA